MLCQSRDCQHNAQDVCLASVTHFKQKMRSNSDTFTSCDEALGVDYQCYYFTVTTMSTVTQIVFLNALGCQWMYFQKYSQCPKGVLRTQILLYRYEKQAPIIVNNTLVYTSKLL